MRYESFSLSESNECHWHLLGAASSEPQVRNWYSGVAVKLGGKRDSARALEHQRVAEKVYSAGVTTRVNGNSSAY
jgi:hypothetical protein